MTKRLFIVALIGALFGIAADAGWGFEVGLGVGVFMTLVGVMNVFLIRRQESRERARCEPAAFDLAGPVSPVSRNNGAGRKSPPGPDAFLRLGARCGACGGNRLSWRVHRSGTRYQAHSGREIRWLCRDCDHEWADPIG